MQHGGFSANLPKLFSSALSATFPCVLKRTDLNGGVGVVQARSPGDLFGLRHEGLWADQPVLIEEFIPGAKEYVTHVVCSEGRILWHHTFQYVMRDDDPIRRPSSRYAFTSTRLEPATLGVFAKILAAFGYDGPANIDFKMRRSRPVVLEINPRLGGSLMRPENTRILAQSLREIIRAAMQKSSLRPALSDVS
jgi:carbamoylphosphate synthase large subunit